VKHHNFLKLKLLQPKFTIIIFELLWILNPVHPELCELIFVYSSNRTLFPSIRIIVCARGWQRANLGSLFLSRAQLLLTCMVFSNQILDECSSREYASYLKIWGQIGRLRKFEVNREIFELFNFMYSCWMKTS